ncbi:MAG TPA: hypothetical protein VGD65_26670 [Chryseosolibacter sp.]
MHRLITLFLLLASFFCNAQSKIAELEKRNGFKDLKLGMPIDSVKGFKLKKEFKEKDEFDAKLYSVENPVYASIGEVKINTVELKTYKDKVYQIHVITDKDPRLMKALESIYGIAEYDIKRETYFWKGQSLILKFRSFSRNQLELIYTSYLAFNQMKDDKGKKVQDIADDF